MNARKLNDLQPKASHEAALTNEGSPTPGEQAIHIGKTVIASPTKGPSVIAQLFTMTIGSETIELLPQKNWIQLDTFKWRTRGILPRTPPGLQITKDQLKFADQTVSTWEVNACEKLELAFNQWLARERQSLELVKTKAQESSQPRSTELPEEDVVHFKLDVSNPQLPRIQCLEGTQLIKTVALNQQGLTALIEQGLMRKPNTLKVGALHNWIELDGQMFRFKEDPNQADELEKTLNERYTLGYEADAPADVLVFPNPASPTGFDIQFPATPTGVVENRKRHLNEETIQLLQDPERCRVLRKGITAKLAPPDLIFKVKTAEGGEHNLEAGPDSLVSVSAQDGQAKTIDLSQPVSLLQLGVPELMAIFNHPAVNRRARYATRARSREGLHQV